MSVPLRQPNTSARPKKQYRLQQPPKWEPSPKTAEKKLTKEEIAARKATEETKNAEKPKISLMQRMIGNSMIKSLSDDLQRPVPTSHT